MMRRNKSPGIPRKGYVSGNDNGSTGGSSGHSGDTQAAHHSLHSTQPLLTSLAANANTISPNNHNSSHCTTGTASAHQELAKHSGGQSNSSADEHLNDDCNQREPPTNQSISNGSESRLDVIPSASLMSSSRDDLDSLLPQSSDAQRTRAAIEHFHSKINRTKEAIKAEQNSRDDNVNEYLKLASNADKSQLQRIKNVFEKKNQKSAQTIAHLQKKLDNYSKKIKELETRGSQIGHHKQTREMLRDVGQGLKDVGVNIKEGITGLSGGVIGGIKSGISAAAHTAGETVMIKPREFFKNRFGSSENVNSAEKFEDSANSATVDTETGDAHHKPIVTHHISNFGQSHSHSHSTKYTSDDESSSMTSGSGHIGAAIIASIGGSSVSPHRKHKAMNSSNIVVTEASAGSPSIIDIEHLINELKERREESQRLSEEVESFKSQLQNECSVFHQSLTEERYRFERLEEQMNDLIELHQNEIENLKQCMADMEEKVQYQSEERLRDVHEMLESCQTRISRMEHQQHQHLQQLVNLDSLENSNARALVLKLINVVLTILQVVLLLVATIANIVSPFLQSRVRIVSSIIVLSVIMILFQQWPDFGSWTRQKISENWIHFSSNIDSG